MRHFFKAYFNFNKKERRGIIVLLTIIIVLILILNGIKYFYPVADNDFSRFEKEIEAFKLEQAGSKDSTPREPPVTRRSPTVLPQFHAFNPNNLAEKQWKQFGLNQKQIRTIKNFEAKGGHFYHKEDLRKIYGISDQLYKSLEPYITIPQPNKRKLPAESMIELNISDSSQLVQLRGVGPVFAKRIIAFRNKLGGFYRMEQLLEVYGLDSALYFQIKSQLTLNPALIRTLNINIATVEELKDHPYISYRLATVLVNYRQKHGSYKAVDAIRQIDLVNEDLYRKIALYLTTK